VVSWLIAGVAKPEQIANDAAIEANVNFFISNPLILMSV